MRAALCSAVVLSAVGVGAARADTPLPQKAVGARAAASPAPEGLVAGASFRVGSAILERDFYGDLNIYFFKSPRACGTISASDAPFVWISIDNGGRRLAVGEVLTTAPGVRVAANVTVPKRQILISDRVAVRFARIDPRVGSLWYGSIRIERQAGVARAANELSGAFSALWCGEA